MKLKSSLLWVIFILPCSFAFSGHFSLRIEIRGQPANPVVVGSVKGDRFSPLDTVQVAEGAAGDAVKNFIFDFPPNAPSGMYRVILGQTTYARVMDESPQQLDFIFNQEDIALTTHFKSPEDSLEVLRSKENDVWFGFIHREKKISERLEELEIEVDYYQGKLAAVRGADDPAPREEVVELQKEADAKTNQFNQLQLERDLFIKNTLRGQEHLFAARLIRNFREPFRDGYLSTGERKASFQKDYFRYVDFSDEMLINSHVLTEKVFDFLVSFNRPGLSPGQRETAYTEAVDQVMAAILNDGCPPGGTVYEFILNYLVSGFERLGMDAVLEYIAGKYSRSLCESDEKTTLVRKLEAQKMNPGTIVPDFSLNDLNGDPVVLSQILKKQNLLFFWASWCPHCKKMLPGIKSWAAQKNKDDLEVIAVSLDRSGKAWKEAVSRAGFEGFYNLSDLKAWDGEVAEDYNVYATPTMFLIDRDRRILEKPASMNELMRF